MAIIRPSLKFEGGELNLNSSAAPYIREGVRKALFNKTTNQEGVYVYFLPAYKADNNGNGVWYKRLTIRDQFGTNFKEKYFVENRATDPAEYFANNFRLLYPEDAKVVEQESNGKKYKKYPACGRIAERVIYNVAFSNNLGLGAHVLDLPLRNGADILMNWLEGKDISGNPRQPVNTPERCVPVFIRLKENSQNPWMIQVDVSQPVQLPDQLADSDYLYNLDEILVIKSKDDIVAKLREMYAPDVFDDCMNGYAGLTRGSVQGNSLPRAAAAPAVSPAPALQAQEIARPTILPPVEVPKATMTTTPAVVSAVAVPTAPIAPVNAPAAADISGLPPNPMAAGRISREAAMAYITQE